MIIRGFRKFTGLTAEDEDEESGATGRKEAFFFSGAAAARFAVTTKSNGPRHSIVNQSPRERRLHSIRLGLPAGENGKFAARRVGGQLVLFGGSKNACHVWRAEQDVRALHQPEHFPSLSEHLP